MAENPRDAIPLADAEAPTAKSPDEAPDGGYGWVIIASAFWLNAHSWGIISSYGVFLSYYLSHSTFPGTTQLDYALIGGLSTSQALIVAPVASHLSRILGVRFAVLSGIMLETAALIGASFATQKWHLYLSFGLCLGWGIGMSYTTTVAMIPQWFRKRRGLASGIAAGGSGMGGLIYSLASEAMVRDLGTAWTFRTLAIVQFIVNLICMLLLKSRDRQVGARQIPFDSKLFARPEYWAFLGWAFFGVFGFVVLLFSLPDYAESIHLTSSQGAIVGAIFNLGQAVGRPAVGYLGDVVGRINMASIGSILSIVVCFAIWFPAKGYGVLILFSLLAGTVVGTFWVIVAPVATEVVGLEDLPACLSMMWVILVLPGLFAEPIVLEMRKPSSGSRYLDVQLLTGFIFVGATLCACCCGLGRFEKWKNRAPTRLWHQGSWDKEAVFFGTLQLPWQMNSTTASDGRRSETSRDFG